MYDIVKYKDNGKEIKVVTYKQISIAFNCEEESLRKNFSRNKDKFILGEDYFSNVTNCHNIDISSPRGITIFTERGLLKHMKMTGTDEAWKGYDMLLDTYFRMENRRQVNLPSNYIEALEALVVSEKAKEKLAIENAIMKPKADYFDALVDKKLLTNFRDTAKELGIKEREFIKFLIDGGYIYKNMANKNKPYAKFTGTLFELKEFNNSTHTGIQTLITPRGRETFRLLMRKEII